MKTTKAMSPLIATVLLIAFAVAIGAMIMNWSTSLDTQEETISCQGVALSASTTPCYTNNSLQVTLKNEGNELIQGILVTIQDGEFLTDIQLSTTLIAQEALKQNFPYAFSGEEESIVFSPIVKEDDIQRVCEDNGFSVEQLPACS